MPAAEQYFAPSPAAPSAPRRVELVLPDLRLSLAADRGTFSAERIDAGTKLLLLEAPPPPDDLATAADVGCGYGPIALTLARRRPAATVWAVDVNERALALCQANAAQAGIPNVVTAAAAAVPASLAVELVWSNPPIRIGKDLLHGLLGAWLDRLTPGGSMVLVVHKHLGADSLQRWLEGRGNPTTRLVSRAGYRLLDVRPSARVEVGP